MRIKTKFELQDEVAFMYKGTPNKGTIAEIRFTATYFETKIVYVVMFEEQGETRYIGQHEHQLLELNKPHRFWH